LENFNALCIYELNEYVETEYYILRHKNSTLCIMIVFTPGRKKVIHSS